MDGASPRRVQKGQGFWPVGGAEPVKVKRTFQNRDDRHRASHEDITTPVPLDGRRPGVFVSAPFGTEVDYASNTAGSGGRLKLLVDGGARCVEVRGKSSAGRSTHGPPISQRNVLTGHGDIATHAASAHMSATLSGGRNLSDLSLKKAAPGQGAKKHLYTPRNVITGEGVCELTDTHKASAHIAGIGSDSHEASRGGLRTRSPRTLPSETGANSTDSPPRNILLGHGMATHHQSAHLAATASASARAYRETPKNRRDPMRSSAHDLLHFHEDTRPAFHRIARAENALQVQSMPTDRRPSSSQMYGGERPF